MLFSVTTTLIGLKVCNGVVSTSAAKSCRIALLSKGKENVY